MTRPYRLVLIAIGALGLSAASASAASIVINEVLYDPATTLAGDANGDGAAGTFDDEFVELVNTSRAELDISGYTVNDNVNARHTFAQGTVLAAGEAIVIFGGGAPTGSFGGAQVVTASSGRLELNNTGDTVFVFDATGGLVTSFSYVSGDADDQSLTRDPDLTGGFVEHSTAAGSGGALFSPGTKADGTPFGPIPEPSAALLCLLGAGALARRRRR